MEEYRDITEKYRVIESGLLEQDGPVAGFLCGPTEEFFVFEVVEILRGVVFLWLLVPVSEEQIEHDPVDTMGRVEKSTALWISIIEDRRGASPALREQVMHSQMARVLWEVRGNKG